jgi:hypothetical protein
MPATGSPAYEQVAEQVLGRAPAQRGVMFGMPCLKLDGKAFAGFYQDSMVFKLCGTAHERALALEGAQLFNPSGRMPMKDWVQVPARHSERWPAFADEAIKGLQR